jgi:hypothetical protein
MSRGFRFREGEMTKHTPGPWVVAEDVFNDRPEIRDMDGRLIAVVMAHYPMSATTQSANARLIAAAPELLEALKWLNAEFECRDDDFGGVLFTRNDFDRVRKAIAKAEGGEE